MSCESNHYNAHLTRYSAVCRLYLDKTGKKRLHIVRFHFFDTLEKEKKIIVTEDRPGRQVEEATTRDVRKLYEVTGMLFILTVGVIMQL